EVMVGLSGQTMAALQAVGQPVPRPVLVPGLLDTGSDVTGIELQGLQQLGAPLRGTGTTSTGLGTTPVSLFEGRVSIPPPRRAPGAPLVCPSLTVMNLPQPIPGVEALVGLDVLLGCRLFLDGPNRKFSLDF